MKKSTWILIGAFLVGLFVGSILLLFRENFSKHIYSGRFSSSNSHSLYQFDIGSSLISTVDKMNLMYIPAGEFKMGSEEYDIDESPIHNVFLDAFWIDSTEVTNEMYSNFLNAQDNQSEGGKYWLDSTGRDVMVIWKNGHWRPKDGHNEHPVTNVNWYGAQAYCEWAGRRLPTEAEWEKAARGGLDLRIYPWGDEWPVCVDDAQNGANFWGLYCARRTIPVGSYAANGYGLYDMSGNVSEWVADWYDEQYFYEAPYKNPFGPESGNEYSDTRVIRGGSWDDFKGELRVSNRRDALQISSWDSLGFRCATSINP